MGTTVTTELEGWQRGEFSAAGFTHTTYRKGSGPAVVVVHEIPGITPGVLRFAEEVVGAGFTVVMPLLVVSNVPSALGKIEKLTTVVSASKSIWSGGRWLCIHAA